jgi:CubicO group peptidase (beta-lactamase class C family)
MPELILSGAVMKKFIIIAALFILLTGFMAPGYALPDAQSHAIQALLDDACRVSGVPGMSISVQTGSETYFFSSGYADRKNGLPASENTLYELASVSKAFTGAGILLLEARGLLSMTDPIQKYLPWFVPQYRGEPVDRQSLTLNNFLHHTSGLTNSRHSQYIPRGDTPDMLRKTIENLMNAELSFSPGAQYSYGTVNYDVLGLVIEIVSGQSYDDFMTEQVFQPLGLNRTYVYKEDAAATGQLAQGYRTSFFMTTPYNAPDYAGNKPAGYIISCTKDMARWMGIQMGLVRDIPEIFHTVVDQSHRGDFSVPGVNGMYYAAGWLVNTGQTIMEHAGGNPNFATKAVIFPAEQTAICLLSNGANTNIDLVNSVKEILDGNPARSYSISGNQLLDIVLSCATIICCLLAVLFFILGLRKKKAHIRQPMRKKRRQTSIIWLGVTVAVCMIPILIGYNWTIILVWQTYAALAVLISLALLSACVTWFVHVR